ncbi:MAG: cupin domain-containing protein [Chloroflexota bacterium]|jgi:transcriptional regulator with XRE-family HTH domain
MVITEPEVNVGQRIRALREVEGLSLRALAERCGLSINAISQIERGENSPTVSSLHLLATALGVSIADLFKDEQQQNVLYVRPADRLRSEARGVRMESLGIGLANQQIEPFVVIVDPGVDNSDQPINHSGEELVYCVTGEIDYSIADQVYAMRPGDSLIFDATQPHFFHNRSAATTQLLMVFLAGGHRHLAHRLHNQMIEDG